MAFIIKQSENLAGWEKNATVAEFSSQREQSTPKNNIATAITQYTNDFARGYQYEKDGVAQEANVQLLLDRMNAQADQKKQKQFAVQVAALGASQGLLEPVITLSGQHFSYDDNPLAFVHPGDFSVTFKEKNGSLSCETMQNLFILGDMGQFYYCNDKSELIGIAMNDDDGKGYLAVTTALETAQKNKKDTNDVTPITELSVNFGAGNIIIKPAMTVKQTVTIDVQKGKRHFETSFDSFVQDPKFKIKTKKLSKKDQADIKLNENKINTQITECEKHIQVFDDKVFVLDDRAFALLNKEPGLLSETARDKRRALVRLKRALKTIDKIITDNKELDPNYLIPKDISLAVLNAKQELANIQKAVLNEKFPPQILPGPPSEPPPPPSSEEVLSEYAEELSKNKSAILPPPPSPPPEEILIPQILPEPRSEPPPPSQKTPLLEDGLESKPEPSRTTVAQLDTDTAITSAEKGKKLIDFDGICKALGEENGRECIRDQNKNEAIIKCRSNNNSDLGQYTISKGEDQKITFKPTINWEFKDGKLDDESQKILDLMSEDALKYRSVFTITKSPNDTDDIEKLKTEALRTSIVKAAKKASMIITVDGKKYVNPGPPIMNILKRTNTQSENKKQVSGVTIKPKRP